MELTSVVDISLEDEESQVRRRNQLTAEIESDASWQMPIEAFTSQLKSEENLLNQKWKQKRFYKHQNEIIHSLLAAQERTSRSSFSKTDQELEDEEAQNIAKKIAIYGSVAANIFLLLIKMVAAYLSGSLSVIASALDSFLDLLSGAILFLTEILAAKTSEDDYPAGKSRFEPVGIVIFSACMFTATLQLLLSSIQVLIARSLDLEVDLITVVILGVTIVLKFILWLYCRRIGDSEAVNALTIDHRNDVISNIFGVTTALLGYHLRWWIDPLGAVLISIYLMFVWFRTGFSQLSSLTGKTAPPQLLQTLTFIARNHHKDIVAIDTVRAYHYGYNFICELDIVLDPEMPLRIAHDIGEALQNKLESIEQVERAFVHLDYEFEHKPEHSGNK